MANIILEKPIVFYDLRGYTRNGEIGGVIGVDSENRFAAALDIALPDDIVEIEGRFDGAGLKFVCKLSPTTCYVAALKKVSGNGGVQGVYKGKGCSVTSEIRGDGLVTQIEELQRGQRGLDYICFEVRAPAEIPRLPANQFYRHLCGDSGE